MVGPYFVLLFCSMLFTIIFGVATIVQWKTGRLSKGSLPYAITGRGHTKLLLIGLFDALNGLMVVYASLPWHVPSAFQPLLLQATIPFNLALTLVVLRRRRYSLPQLFGAALVVGGIMLSLGNDIAHPTGEFISGQWWIAVLVGACIPGVLMNIVEEGIFDDLPSMSISLILAVESFYQLFFIAAFW